MKYQIQKLTEEQSTEYFRNNDEDEIRRLQSLSLGEITEEILDTMYDTLDDVLAAYKEKIGLNSGQELTSKYNDLANRLKILEGRDRNLRKRYNSKVESR